MSIYLVLSRFFTFSDPIFLDVNPISYSLGNTRFKYRFFHNEKGDYSNQPSPLTTLFFVI